MWSLSAPLVVSRTLLLCTRRYRVRPLSNVSCQENQRRRPARERRWLNYSDQRHTNIPTDTSPTRGSRLSPPIKLTTAKLWRPYINDRSDVKLVQKSVSAWLSALTVGKWRRHRTRILTGREPSAACPARATNSVHRLSRRVDGSAVTHGLTGQLNMRQSDSGDLRWMAGAG